MLHKHVDKVYVVNLPTSKDRAANIAKQCYNIGCKYELFPAIDGRKEDVEWFENQYAKDVHGWTQGAAGLVYTTINIIEDAKKKGYKSILILEDDIKFKPMVNEIVDECVKTLPENWDMFHLTAQHFKQPQRLGPSLLRLNGAWSCQAYMVNERIYDKYLEWLKLVDRPIDSVTSEKIHSRGNSFAPLTNLIITDPNVSTIRGSFINYNV